MATDLENTARLLVAGGKGILAADETPGTLTRRLDALKIESTPDSRRAYREMFFTTPGIAEFISGVIMQNETIRQKSSTGIALADLLAQQGIIPGIKVDNGAKPLAGSPGENITDGLDGLRERLKEYRDMGARFAKWRAVIAVSDTLPSTACVQANAHALARYAALCQEQGVAPIVEPEVLMDGSHTIERCEEVTANVLHAVFNALFDQNVSLEGMLLKPNMVISGIKCGGRRPSAKLRQPQSAVSAGTFRPRSPALSFLSGGQNHLIATEHLSAINQLDPPKPWKLSFSYGRALQDEALKAWQGKNENLKAGQRAFNHRAKCDSAAALGKYSTAMEGESAVA